MTQLTKSPLTCILHSHTVNNKHLFTQKCEVVQNSEKTWTYSSSRSSKVIDLGANRKRICNFL